MNKANITEDKNDDLRELLIYLTNNKDNLEKIKLPSLESIKNKIFSNFSGNNHGYETPYLTSLNIDKKKHFKIRCDIYNNFFDGIEKKVNEFVFINIFSKIIEILDNSNKFSLESFDHEFSQSRYLLDTKVPHDISDYNDIDSFLRANYEYKDDEYYRVSLNSNIITLKDIFYDEFTHFIHDIFYKSSINSLEAHIDTKKFSDFKKDYNQNKQFTMLKNISQLYFNEILKMPFSNTFFLYNHSNHMNKFPEHKRVSKELKNEGVKKQKIETGINFFIDILKRGNLSFLKIVTLNSCTNFSLGKGSLGNDNAKELKNLKGLLYSAIKYNLDINVIRREITPLLIKDSNIEKLSSFVITNKGIISLNLDYLEYNYLRIGLNGDVRDKPQNLSFVHFDKNILNFLTF
jgi:hypothetical protein